MKQNIKIYLITCLLCCGMFSCDNHPKNQLSKDFEIQLGEKEECRHYTDDYYDFEIIPLETKKECMLSDCQRVFVTDAGIYVSDSENNIYLFNHDGSFKCRIGAIGHANNEYVDVFDLSTTINGDTVAVLSDLKTLKMYNSEGKFIGSKSLEFDVSDDEMFGWDNILFTPNGMMMNNYHRVYDKLLYLLEPNSDSIIKFIDVDKGVIRSSPDRSFVPLQYDNNLVCYYDQLSSRFYILNLNDYNDIKSYALKSDNILTEEKARKIDLMSDDYDCVDSYVFADSMIVGNMSYKGYCCEFKLDLRDNSMKLFTYEDFGANFVDYYKGYYYDVLYSDFLADLMKVDINDKSTPYYKIDQYKMLHKALEPYKDKISEKDNYYLLKVKMKK